MNYLITGGCGFLGSNLAAEVLRRREPLTVLDNLSRVGARKNLQWLRSLGEFDFVQQDVRHAAHMSETIERLRPDAVFHLAGQVAMTTSLADPRSDFETNALGSLNILEGVRQHSPESLVLYSSTNKVYGDLQWARWGEQATRYVAVDYPRGFPESIRIDFQSPYGCSKGAADMYMLDYARMYGLRTVVFRHSSMYGGRQFSTYDQGWVGWFCQQAIETKNGRLDEPFTISGDGKQVRDLLHAEDMVRLYFSAVECIDAASGRAFNVGGGPENSMSLLELFEFLERELDVQLKWRRLPPRHSDQLVFIADIRQATERLEWQPRVNAEQGLRSMIDWVKQNA